MSVRMEKCVYVLDHGFVRLVDSMGTDLSVVRAARVSYDAAWRAGGDEKSDEKLIGYLMRNKHTTPFESVVFQFEVKAPIFVLRQWHRHRTWSYNELSARYRELPSEFYVPKPEHVGTQSASSKQAREINGVQDFDENRRRNEIAVLAGLCAHSFDTYKDLLDCGWPKELARMVLPLNTYSHMFARVDLHNLMHFLRLRLHPHAQYEIRVYAEAMRDLAYKIAPVCMREWENTL
jgi:thymidylate synthase (FAD)